MNTAVLCAVGVGLASAYHLWGVGIPCPFRYLTGWQCPLCGTTRAVAAVIRGDLVQAWHLNPLSCVGGVILGLLCVMWIVEICTGRTPRFVTTVRTISPASLYSALAAVAVIFTLWRNLS